MAESGISLFLERIAQNPKDERLLQRFLVLMAEEPDNPQKCAELLLVAQTCSISQPQVALQIALAVFHYARLHEATEEMRRAAKISMASLKALGRMGAARAIRIELERLGVDVSPGASVHSPAPRSIREPEQDRSPVRAIRHEPEPDRSPVAGIPPAFDLAAMDETVPVPVPAPMVVLPSSAKKKVASPVIVQSPPVAQQPSPPPVVQYPPREEKAVPLSSLFTNEHTDAAFLAAISPPLTASGASAAEEHEEVPERLLPNFDDVVSAALAESRLISVAPASELAAPEPSYLSDPGTVVAAKALVHPAPQSSAKGHQELGEPFWNNLLLAICTTKDGRELAEHFPSKKGLTHFLMDHFRSIGIDLPQQTCQKLVALLHGDVDFSQVAFREDLSYYLWHALGAQPMLKLLESAGVARMGDVYWGYYLDILLGMQNARRAWYEIRSTLTDRSDERWAAVAAARLPTICHKLKLQEITWEPSSGIPALVYKLSRRPPPTLGGFLVGK